jgi:hypothetical protein
VGREGEDDVSPVLAHLDEPVPPSFVIPPDIRVVRRVVQSSTPVEYAEEHVIVQLADRPSRAWRPRAFCFIGFCSERRCSLLGGAREKGKTDL